VFGFSSVNNTAVVIKLLVILLFIVVGGARIDPANWHPFLPFGAAGVLSGASIVFVAYVGFDQISTTAEEARSPARDVPLGILLSLAIAAILYVSVAAVLTGMVSYEKLNVSSPVSHALILAGLHVTASIISVGAILGLTTGIIALLFGQSRIFFSMSRDGLLPPLFSRVHPRLRTPFLSSIFVGVTVALIAGFIPLGVVVELVNIGTLTAFIIVAVAVLVLRRTQPDLPRGFRLPLVPWIPVLSIVASLVLVAALPRVTLIRFVLWLIIGLAVYFAYGRQRSKMK
jgi:basic amino acid/polyamine antiporter, APA family